jgi:putative transposase
MAAQFPKRKSPRLQGYDYSQSGAYFVTICTYQRAHLFGDIREDAMHLNPIGEIACQRWQAIPHHHSNAELDLFVIMPNHMHGIIILTDEVGTRPASSAATLRDNRPQRVQSGSLSIIIGSYKSGTTRRIRVHLRTPGRIVWQGRYHDHIIRSPADLDRIREYVLNNPARWTADRFYSESI